MPQAFICSLQCGVGLGAGAEGEVPGEGFLHLDHPAPEGMQPEQHYLVHLVRESTGKVHCTVVVKTIVVSTVWDPLQNSNK